MNRKNYVTLANVLIFTLFNSMGIVFADRGYIETSKSMQILFPGSTPISTGITGTAMTCETWIYLEDLSLADGMLFYNINGVNGFQFGFSQNRIIFQNGGAGRTVDVWLDYKSLSAWNDFVEKEWMHIALVVDENNWKLFLNGAIVYDQSLAGGYTKHTSNFLIAGDWWKRFGGKMADIRVWNCARTQTEIADNMRKIIPIDTPDLIARLNFTEGAGAGSSTNLANLGGAAWPTSGTTLTWGIVAKTPHNLDYSNITNSGFTLTWEGGDETAYRLELTDESGSTTIHNASTKSYTFSGLDGGIYKVKVMSTMPLETEFSEEITVNNAPTGLTYNTLSGIILSNNNDSWGIIGIDHAVEISVYNQTGKLINRIERNADTNIEKTLLPGGVYYIKINSEKGQSIFKAIK